MLMENVNRDYLSSGFRSQGASHRGCTYREPDGGGFQRGERGLPNLQKTIALLAHLVVPFNCRWCLNVPS